MADRGKTFSVTQTGRELRISWGEFRGSFALRLVPILLVAPCAAAILAGAAAGGPLGALAFAAVLAVLALLGVVMMGGRTELRLGLHGLELTTRRFALPGRKRFVPLPIRVRIEPLWGSAEQLNPDEPTEWSAAFFGPDGMNEAVVVLEKAGITDLRACLAALNLPGVTVDEPESGKDQLSTACQKCGYDLVGLAEPRCPECGEPLSEATLALARLIHAERRAGDAQR